MKTTMRWTALLLAAALLVSCAGCKKSGGQGTTQDGEYDQSGNYRPALPNVSAELADAVRQNSDVVGWLTLPNTTINEAVVQTTNNDYYLRRDVKKNYAYEGCYYMDYESVMFDNGADLAQNTIIYGHNLGSPMGVKDDPEGAKFAQLLKLEDIELAKKTPYVYLTTEGAAHVFEIFAVFYCEAETSPRALPHGRVFRRAFQCPHRRREGAVRIHLRRRGDAGGPDPLPFDLQLQIRHLYPEPRPALRRDGTACTGGGGLPRDGESRQE